jgi:hypothetical protein
MLLAECYTKLGRFHHGLQALAEAEQIIESSHDRYSEADLHRLRGDLLSAVGDHAAEQSYHEVLVIANV